MNSHLIQQPLELIIILIIIVSSEIRKSKQNTTGAINLSLILWSMAIYHQLDISSHGINNTFRSSVNLFLED